MARDGRATVRWSRLLLALALGNFGTGALFVVLYAAHPFELWGRLEFFEDPGWVFKLVVGMLIGGLLAIPLPTALSGLAVWKLKNVVPWYGLVAAGPTLSALLIPVYLWTSPSNVVIVIAVLVIGVVASIALVRALRAVVVSEGGHT